MSKACPLATVMLLTVLMSARAHAAAPPSPPAQPFAKLVASRIESALDLAEKDGDFKAPSATLAELFDQVIALGLDNDPVVFRDCAFARRLVLELGDAEPDVRVDLLKFLRKNKELAHTLVFLIRPGSQKPGDVFATLQKLRAARGDKLETYATLTAAICAVHCGPALLRHINENTVKAPNALAIFDYYVQNERQMVFGIRPVPAEMLMYVVDTTSPINEMQWALNQYAGDQHVGARFFDIKYDRNHLNKGTPKALTENGFSLPNILKYGGVCADQAYFAVTIGKAIGVPTAYCTAQGAVAGHAWVGFLEAQGNQGYWNFNSGRYEAYKGIRGNVLDPQTRHYVADSVVSVLAELIHTSAADRQTAAAMTDAAMRLIRLDEKNQPLNFTPLDVPCSAVLREARKVGPVTELGLLERGLNSSRGYVPGWLAIAELADAGKMSLDQKKHWAATIQTLCAGRYPDFALAIMAPMVETVDDPKEQDALWNNLFNMFPQRPDLAASVRMAQARMWEQKGQPVKAGQCYMDVIDRFANAGPFVIDALLHAEKLLRDMDARKIVVLYDRTWTQLKKPTRAVAEEFAVQSTWYQVGQMYAERLDQANMADKAAQVYEQLKSAFAAPR